jgi:hypothetical protein
MMSKCPSGSIAIEPVSDYLEMLISHKEGLFSTKQNANARRGRHHKVHVLEVVDGLIL